MWLLPWQIAPESMFIGIYTVNLMVKMWLLEYILLIMVNMWLLHG